MIQRVQCWDVKTTVPAGDVVRCSNCEAAALLATKGFTSVVHPDILVFTKEAEKECMPPAVVRIMEDAGYSLLRGKVKYRATATLTPTIETINSVHSSKLRVKLLEDGKDSEHKALTALLRDKDASNQVKVAVDWAFTSQLYTPHFMSAGNFERVVIWKQPDGTHRIAVDAKVFVYVDAQEVCDLFM